MKTPRVFSEQARRNMAAGQLNSEAARANLARIQAIRKGKPISEEHRRNLSEAQKRRHGKKFPRFLENGKRTPEYMAWSCMKTRCYNPKRKDWENYGGRGITVCERWLNSYDAFREDMGECPPGDTIERENNDGNYEPGNCVWASRSVQVKNRRPFKHKNLRVRNRLLGKGLEYNALQPSAPSGSPASIVLLSNLNGRMTQKTRNIIKTKAAQQ